MGHGIGTRNRRRGLRMMLAAVATGTAFQLSSCSLDEGGVLSAFADTGGLSEWRNTLVENSPFGQFLDGVNGSVQVDVGGDQ